MNVYSNSFYSVIKYLKDIEINICNLLIMTGNFNIHDSLWNSSFPYHLSISNNLIIIADSFNLNLLIPSNYVPTKYSNNNNDSNSVINLMFLWCSFSKLDNHTILPNWQLTSDYVLLTITIPITEANINYQKWTIIKNSEEEKLFIKKVITSFAKLNTSNVSEILQLENIINDFANIVNSVWIKHSKVVNITKHSKSWWNFDCDKALIKYRFSKNIDNWKVFQKMVKNMKRTFFDLKIQECTNKKHGPWDLMSWINKQNLLAIEMIKHNGQLCLDLEDLWQALHLSFNIT